MGITKWHLPKRFFRLRGGPDFFDLEDNVRTLADEQIANSTTVSTLTSPITIGAIKIVVGSGTPEGVVTAAIGSLFLRTDGSTSTTLYVKTSGTGNTGWTAK